MKRFKRGVALAAVTAMCTAMLPSAPIAMGADTEAAVTVFRQMRCHTGKTHAATETGETYYGSGYLVDLLTGTYMSVYIMAGTPTVTTTLQTEPTATPTAEPTETPTATPTAEPTATPTAEPTQRPLVFNKLNMSDKAIYSYSIASKDKHTHADGGQVDNQRRYGFGLRNKRGRLQGCSYKRYRNGNDA